MTQVYDTIFFEAGKNICENREFSTVLVRAVVRAADRSALLELLIFAVNLPSHLTLFFFLENSSLMSRPRLSLISE